MNAFGIIGAVFAGLAAVIHVAIFALQSVLWSRPTTWRRFGLGSQRDADVVRPMAFNQGFYNLFLALGAGAGLVLVGVPSLEGAGFAVLLFALLSMVLAATVLITSSPALSRAAMLQGAAPLIGVVLLIVGAATR
ncbi:MAG TPA: DUF1304 domain-containing protein [Pseudolysinimonas sp.]|nr:DUF1304 domain-containing protein [Pseudolysinimonas sp.]